VKTQSLKMKDVFEITLLCRFILFLKCNFHVLLYKYVVQIYKRRRMYMHIVDMIIIYFIMRIDYNNISYDENINICHLIF